ncbi:MAG: hypothetical protein WCP24_02785 [bacterium]
MKKKKYYIEDCFCLFPLRVRRMLHDLDNYGRKTDHLRKDISYDTEEIDGQWFVLITIEGHEQQRVTLNPSLNNPSEGNYFICDGCKKMCGKLYLLPGGCTFRCQECHRLTYKGFRPSSRQDMFVRKAERIIRLAESQDDMIDRIWKRDIETKKYAELIADCTKVGLKRLVADLKDLEKVVKNRRPRRKKEPIPQPFIWKSYSFD